MRFINSEQQECFRFGTLGGMFENFKRACLIVSIKHLRKTEITQRYFCCLSITLPWSSGGGFNSRRETGNIYKYSRNPLKVCRNFNSYFSFSITLRVVTHIRKFLLVKSLENSENTRKFIQNKLIILNIQSQLSWL